MLDFPVLHDLKGRGGDRLLRSAGNQARSAAIANGDPLTDRPDGFTASEIDELTGISQRLAVLADMFAQHAVGENVLKAYINIGAAAARLDFTVIGPAVNLVSRVEAVARALDLPIVVSEAFARAYGGNLRLLGRHELREAGGSHELFAPELPPA